MKGKVKIGLVCLLRKTFDYESAWVEFKNKEADLKDKGVKAVYNTLLDNGFAHHVVMAYGDYVDAFKILAKIKGWEWIEA